MEKIKEIDQKFVNFSRGVRVCSSCGGKLTKRRSITIRVGVITLYYLCSDCMKSIRVEFDLKCVRENIEYVIDMI